MDNPATPSLLYLFLPLSACLHLYFSPSPPPPSLSLTYTLRHTYSHLNCCSFSLSLCRSSVFQQALNPFNHPTSSAQHVTNGHSPASIPNIPPSPSHQICYTPPERNTCHAHTRAQPSHATSASRPGKIPVVMYKNKCWVMQT